MSLKFFIRPVTSPHNIRRRHYHRLIVTGLRHWAGITERHDCRAGCYRLTFSFVISFFSRYSIATVTTRLTVSHRHFTGGNGHRKFVIHEIRSRYAESCHAHHISACSADAAARYKASTLSPLPSPATGSRHSRHNSQQFAAGGITLVTTAHCRVTISHERIVLLLPSILFVEPH